MKKISPPRPPASLPRRRLCLAADVEQYGGLDTRTQSAVQSQLVRTLDEAATLAGLDRAAWQRQPQGDLEFAVLPEATQEDAVLGPFVRHLAVCIGASNASSVAQRVRLRMAVDSGVVADGALGHAGPTPVAVARYVNAPPLRAVLATLTAADLAVLVSDRLYQDVVQSGRPGLDPAQYVRVHVRVKEFGGYGWIHVPGHAPDNVRLALAKTSEPKSTSDVGAPNRTALSQYVHQGAAVGRDVGGDLIVGLPVPPPSSDSWPAR
ncbi:hypothetical protein [Streptomyces albus]|uniref:hypothetical protein n=1 Tax=Streptomyces albus TaxID=1888 RepID=UPI0006E151DC|nr:hypothetical protein [Streptomyces albus]